MECAKAVTYMHEYLDGDLSKEQLIELKLHMDDCAGCHDRFEQLHKTLACIAYYPDEDVSEDFCQRIMGNVPKVKMMRRLFSWMKLYPYTSVASMCGLIFFGAWIMSLDMERKLVVKIPNQDSVVINGSHVHIPEQTIIHGDVFVQNGTIQVEGLIEGDLVVMNGEYAIDSPQQIEGEIHQISYPHQRWLLQIENWFD